MDSSTHDDLFKLTSYTGPFTTTQTSGHIEIRTVGRLQAPSGRLIFTDPQIRPLRPEEDEAPPAHLPVPPGDYDIRMSVAVFPEYGTEGGCGVLIELSGGDVTQWDAARGSMAAPLGFGVDAGQGCVLDRQNMAALWRLQDQEDAGELPEFSLMGERASAAWPSHDDAAVVVFDCGLGDGGYPVYVGIDSAGAVVRACVNLGLLGELTLE